MRSLSLRPPQLVFISHRRPIRPSWWPSIIWPSEFGSSRILTMKCCFCASGICRLDMESNQRKAREATDACDAAQKEVAALQKVVKKKEQELVQKDEDFHEQCATPFCFRLPAPLAPSCL